MFLTLLISIYIAIQSGYKLIWRDEFNESKWSYDLGGDGWGNRELEFYTNRGQNAYVSDGKLNIREIKRSYEGKDYSSARILTKVKFEFL